EPPPTATVAGATDAPGAPAGARPRAAATVPRPPTSPGPATPPSSVPPPRAKARAPAATAMPAPVNPAPPAPAAVNGTDISGKWVGSWVGTGLFHGPRQENLSLEIVQKGDAGYGRMILDNAVAAESVPWEVRQQGLGGIRVFAEVNGSKVKLVHERDDRLFTANLTVTGDQMVGEVKGRKVRLLPARQSPSHV